MSAATGFLIRATDWQQAFIIEGAVAVVWGVFWLALVRDTPREVRWLGPAPVAALESEMEREQQQLPRMVNLWLAFRDRNVIRLCINYFFWSLGIYGFVLWLPVVIHNATQTGIAVTGLLSAVPYLAAVLLMLAVSHFSDRSGRRGKFVWPVLMLAGAALAGSFFSLEHSFGVAYFCLIVAASCMYAPYGPFFAMVPEMLPKNVAGETMALINSCGALGGFFGVWGVGLLRTSTGNSQAGFLLMSLSLIVSGAVLLSMKEGGRRIELTPEDR